MTHLLYKYLIIHKQVTLPGIGVFSINRKPASHDLVNKTFQSPVFDIDFSSKASIADKDFFIFVSREKGIDEAEASKHLHDFAYRLKEEVSLNKIVELPGIGVLRKDDLGRLSLRSADVIGTYFPTVIPEDAILEVNNKTSSENGDSVPSSETINAPGKEPKIAERAKDYWWVYAIVLALIGISGIVYYYYQNKSFR
jgi:nucleoid DNA-binding protein